MLMLFICAILLISAVCYADQRQPLDDFAEPDLQIDELMQESMDIKQESKEKEIKAIVQAKKEEASTPKPVYEQKLGKELTDYTIKICNNYKVDPKLVFAIIEKESNYVVDVVSSSQDYGLMQINAINHPRLKKELKISNLLDAKSNIFAGVYMLAGIQGNDYDSLHKVLMVYNQGGASAKRSWNNGVTSSEYSRSVIDKMKRL